MKKARFIFFGVVVVLLVALALPLSAQNDLGPGEGAPIIWPNFGGDPTNLNPLLISDGPSQDIANVIFPSFVKIDPHTGSIDPRTAGSIADSWTVSDDGKVYTFTLRDDYTWTDGTPITSADVKYAYDAVKSGLLDSPLNGYYDVIESLEAPDPQTVVVTFAEADCSALSTLKTLPPVPAHILEPEIGTDFATMNESEFNMNPTVSSGPFAFSNFRPAEQITLVANQDYPDSDGGVIPEGFIQRQLADQTVSVDEFNAGNLTLLDSVPEDRQAEMEAKAASGEVQMFKSLSSGWQFLGFNVADPTNPQDGQDADGNPIDQGHHPLFGDVRVRQAVAYATNHDALNEGAFAGTGIPVASPLLTTSWAYNSALEPYPFDQEKAMELLDEAGFIDDDNDPATPRVAQGALYAPDGTPLSFAITSYGGNTSVDNTLLLMQDQLGEVGFDVTLDILEFQTMLEKMDGQVLNSIMLFFGGFDASNPDELRSLYASEGDVVNSGFNSSSYYNPQVDALFAQARNLPGCDLEARKALYEQIQQILYDDLPIFYVNTSEVPVVVQPDVANFDPLPLGFAWNISRWSQAPR